MKCPGSALHLHACLVLARRRAVAFTGSLITASLLGGLAAGAVSSCTPDISPRREVVASLRSIESANLRKHVYDLATLGPRRSSDAHETLRTVEYLKTELRAAGCDTIEERVPATSGQPAITNLVVTFTGSEPNSPVLEIGAHYDTVTGTPGADDNASGVAALLEMAKVFIAHRQRRTLRLAFFAAEESGLRGSAAHVAQLIKRGDRLAGAIVLEMIGYATDRPGTQRSPARVPLFFWPPDRGDFIAVVGNLSSGWLGDRFESALRAYVPELHYFSAKRSGGLFRDAMRSDNKPYWDANLHALMLTDTANFRNPNYHRSGDEPSTLNYGFLQRVTQATTAMALLWAGAGSDE